jgi:hypothetical protein
MEVTPIGKGKMIFVLFCSCQMLLSVPGESLCFPSLQHISIKSTKYDKIYHPKSFPSAFVSMGTINSAHTPAFSG